MNINHVSIAAVIGMLSAASANAGDWSFDGGCCGGHVLAGSVYYGAPNSRGDGILANQGQYYPGTTIPLGGYGGYDYRADAYGAGYGLRGGYGCCGTYSYRGYRYGFK